MADITREYFLELKEYTLDLYKTALGAQTLEYHRIIRGGPASGGSTIDERYGFVNEPDEPDDPDQPKTQKTDLLYAHVYLATALGRGKKLDPAGDGFRSDYEIKVFIPTLDIEQKGLTPPIDRDGAFLRMPDGAEYRIETVEPLPRMHGTSLVHRLYGRKRKPIADQPGRH